MSFTIYARRILIFSKMRERLEQQYYVEFRQKHGDCQIQTIWKIQ